MQTSQWAAAQYCDDWSTANPDEPAKMDWATSGRKYLRLCDWARKRYTLNGSLPVWVGDHPAPYKRIEEAAWRKYML